MDFMRTQQRWLLPAIGLLLVSLLVVRTVVAQAPIRVDRGDNDSLYTASELADRAYGTSKTGQWIAETRGAWPTAGKWSSAWKKSSEQQRIVWDCISKLLEKQARFETALGVLRLHYCIAACQMGLEIGSEARAYLQEQELVEDELLKLGGQVDDTTALRRASIELKDRRLVLESKLAELREELSLLVGPQIACSHTGRFDCAPSLELDDSCDFELLGLQQRIELQVLRYIRGQSDWIQEDTLEILSGLVGFPVGLRALWGPVERPGIFVHKSTDEVRAKRRHGLDRWIANRQDEIRLEIRTAYLSKATAVQRWRLAVERSDSLQLRYERLCELSELKGNLPQQVQAKLEWYKARGDEVERWLDWQLADIELHRVSGSVGYWNEESANCTTSTPSSVKDE